MKLLSKSFFIALIVLILISVPLVGACTKQTPTPTPKPAPAPTPAPSPTPTPTPKPSPTPAPSPTPPPAPQPTGELRIALPGLGVEAVDPILGPNDAVFYFRLMYDWIVGATPDGKLSWENGLAKDWKISNDKLTHTFTFRQGVKFHNGKEVTAEDAKFSLERVMSKRSVATNAGTFRKVIKEMKVPDPYTLVITTTEPFVFLPYYLSAIIGMDALIVPKEYVQEKGEEYFASNPIGSGPYRFVQRVPGASIKMEAMPSHWRIGVPKYKTITWKIVPEEATRIAALKTKEVDIISMSIDNLGQVSGFKTYVNKGAVVTGVYIHKQWETAAPYYDKKVREALSIAINRKEIINYVYRGLAEEALSGPVATSMAIGYPALNPIPYDPERAKKLLAEAGFPNGFNLSFYTYPRAEAPELGQLAEVVSGYWDKIGVKAKLIPIDYGAFRAMWNAKKIPVPSVGTHAIGARPMEGALFQLLWHSQGTLNYIANPELDAMVDAVLAAKDIEEYARLQAKAIIYSRENFIEIPIANAGPVYAAIPEITNWEFPELVYDMGMESIIKRK